VIEHQHPSRITHGRRNCSGHIDRARNVDNHILYRLSECSHCKSTGQPCTKCHTAPPALNKYGKKYKESKKNSLARSEQNRLLLTQTRVGFDMDGAVL
jgi:hypothetical protein